MSIYFTGCTHFGHANIIKLANRPFSCVEEMDQTLIDNWNKAVSRKDTIFHLGDFAFRGHPAEHYMDRLNGNVVTVRGNHDDTAWGEPYITFKHNKRKLVLFHYPIEEWDGWFRGSIHLHCHTHASEFVSAERRGNVGVDACHFSPISIDEVEAALT